jgi:hypothetical protein
MYAALESGGDRRVRVKGPDAGFRGGSPASQAIDVARAGWRGGGQVAAAVRRWPARMLLASAK